MGLAAVSGYASPEPSLVDVAPSFLAPMPRTPGLISLADLSQGVPARLAEIQGGHQLVRRMLALGLRLGSPVTVVQRRGQGLVVASGVSRIAIGAGIADKLWVEPASGQPSPDAGDPAG